MTIESSFIPFPSEVVVPPAAYRAATSPDLNVFLVVLFATIGADLGALINYGLSRYLGRPIIYKFADSKIGHLMLIDRDKVMQAEAFFDKHGAVSTFVGRLIPAIRQLISIPAGLAKMSIGRFLLFTTLGALLWNSILATAGYALSAAMPEDEMMETITKYNTEFKIFCTVVIAIALVVFGVKYWRTAKQNQEKKV